MNEAIAVAVDVRNLIRAAGIALLPADVRWDETYTVETPKTMCEAEMQRTKERKR